MMIPGPNGLAAVGRVLQRNETTFVVQPDGALRPIAHGAQTAGANALVDSARATWAASMRDSLGLRGRIRVPAERQQSNRDPRKTLFASRRSAAQAHAAYRAMSRSSSAVGSGTNRYREASSSGRFDIAVDSARGAVTRQFVVGPDGISVTTIHDYAPLPGGDLVRTSSRSVYSGKAGPASDRTVTITYSNVLVR